MVRSFVSALWTTCLLCCFLNCRTALQNRAAGNAFFEKVLHNADSIDDGTKHNPEAFAYLDSIFAVYPDAGYHAHCLVYNFKSWHIVKTGDARLAMLYADSAIWAVNREAPGTSVQVDRYTAQFSMGDAFMAGRKYEEAFTCYFRAQQIIDSVGDSCGAAKLSGKLGLVCYKLERYQEAAAYFLKSCQTFLNCPDMDPFSNFSLFQGGLDNTALCYAEAHMPDSAIYYYDSVKRYITGKLPEWRSPAQRLFMEQALGVVYGNEGTSYYMKHDTARAAALYLQSIGINMHRGFEIEDAQYTAEKLVALYLDSRDTSRAGVILDMLARSLDSFPSRGVEIKYHSSAWHYYNQIGQYRQAYQHLIAYSASRDSVTRINPLKAIDVKGELQHMTSEYNLELLRKRSQLNDIYLVISIVFLCMTILIIALVLRNARKSARHLGEMATLNRQMQDALTTLEQSHRENFRLLAVIAHDLRNPIGACKGFATLLLEKPEMDNEDRHMLEQIEAASDHCLDMIRGLLRSNAAGNALVKVPVDLKDLLQHCKDQLALKAREKKQVMNLSALSIVVIADREKLWRVIGNLLSNAIKFSLPETRIDISLYRREREVLIAIKDRGIGIPADMRDGIFDHLETVRRRGTVGEESFGLGLSISRQIIEAHSGRIWLESEEGKGTTFFISLPDDTQAVDPRQG